jgi:hypothetical protein
MLALTAHFEALAGVSLPRVDATQMDTLTLWAMARPTPGWLGQVSP